jgi:hypothetical protein
MNRLALMPVFHAFGSRRPPRTGLIPMVRGRCFLSVPRIGLAFVWRFVQ